MTRRTAAVIIGTVLVVCNLVADVSGYYAESGDEGWNWIGLIGLAIWAMFAFEKERDA